MLLDFQPPKPVFKTKKRKKKERHNCNQEQRVEIFILAIRINAFKLGKSNFKKKKNKDQIYLNKIIHDTSQVMC